MQTSVFRWASAVVMIAAMPALAVIIENPTGNPYQGIVDRNVFGLRPPPPPPDPELSKPPPPKITLTGITTILGNARALMKTPPPAGKPGEASKGEQYYTLSVGERQGDIEVLEIDTTGGSVKVNNAGSIVTLTFDKESGKGGGGAMGGGVPPPPGAVPPPMPGAGGFGAPAAGGPTGFSMPTRTVRAAGGFGQPAGTEAPGVQPAGFNGMPASNAGLPLANPSAPGFGGATPEQMQAAAQRTPEENVLLYEANRARNQQLIQSGARIPPMPPHPWIGNQGQQAPTPQPNQQTPSLPYAPGIQGGPPQ